MTATLPRAETVPPDPPGGRTSVRIPTFAKDFLQPRHGRLPSTEDFPSIDDHPPAVYTIDHLPPPVLVSKILDCFYTCSGTLFYICTREQSFELFRSLYWSDTQRTKQALAELCAIAAVGSQYDTDLVSNEHRRALFDTAKIYIDDVVEMSELRAMRLYALCGMFSIMDKRIAAWSYVAAGLKIAQTHGLHKKEDMMNRFLEGERAPWRKNWRTLKFLESWLVGTIGRIPDMEHNASPDSIEDLDTSRACPIDEGNCAPALMVIDVDVLQSELGKIGFLTTSIVEDVYAAEACSIRSMDVYMAKLEKWHQELPKYMRFGTVLTADQGSRRSIMLIHLTFLGATMLLTRKTITVLVARPADAPWECDGTKEQAMRYMGVCIQAAENVARIVGCLYDEQGLFKRCWMIINQTFNALALILFHVVQKRRHRRPTEEYVEYIHHASKLVKVLLFCATSDNLAHCYLQTFEPYAVFFDLAGDPDLADVSRQMHNYSPRTDSSGIRTVATASSCTSSSGASTSSASSICTTNPGTILPAAAELSDSELDVLALHLMDILQSPFGGEGRVERCPHLTIKPPTTSTEGNHARFWNSRGFKVPAWDRNQSRGKKLPLKRGLYDGSSEGSIRVHSDSQSGFGKKRKADDMEAFFRRVI